MPFPQFDRNRVHFRPLSERRNKHRIAEMAIDPDSPAHPLDPDTTQQIERIAERIHAAKSEKRSVVLVFGAHSIKNCLGRVLIRLMEEQWVTHLATNGAGIIHDWEFSFQGQSSEDVRAYVDRGQFGNWRETGTYINLALVVGAYRGWGYGESIGTMIEDEGLDLPTCEELLECIAQAGNSPECAERAAAAADLLGRMLEFHLPAGKCEIPHPFKAYSVQAAAHRLNIPFTGHPGIGQDIIYNHPMNHGGALGRCALRDFLTFAHSIENIDGGVYLSIGSAVMSPMIFEKSLSISQNIHLQNGRKITRHTIAVVDLQRAPWDWSQGEPPIDHPAYYLRYCKTFNRMGGSLSYLSVDNRDFLMNLYRILKTSK